ncbi:MAG TPA: LolA-like putative outer membrane lipoprotein chaperone [Bacteroidales bacterium]|nr:LolA-like putative outer membrane lipoprotein chaperone [Bacteroidales bacterium]
MKNKAAYIFILFSLSVSALAQKDPEAMKILDNFSLTARKAPSVTMDFSIVTVNQMENTADTLKGNVVLSGDKYVLELPDNTIWFNGETSWSYLPAENEVTITKPGRKDNSFQSKPSAIFSVYKKDYKVRLVDETTGNYIIDLYPEDIKSDLVRIRLTIAKLSYNPVSIEYKKKDGVTSTLYVKKYNLDRKTGDNTFVFQPSKYRNVEINDIR